DHFPKLPAGNRNLCRRRFRLQIGMIGLGRMGANMSRRLMKGGHTCVVFDRDASKVAEVEKEGARGARSLEDCVNQLAAPRTVWVMLPAGEITGGAIRDLSGLLSK